MGCVHGIKQSAFSEGLLRILSTKHSIFLCLVESVSHNVDHSHVEILSVNQLDLFCLWQS